MGGRCSSLAGFLRLATFPIATGAPLAAFGTDRKPGGAVLAGALLAANPTLLRRSS